MAPAADSTPAPPPTGAIIKYTPWKLHTQITLERPHAPALSPPSQRTRLVHHPISTTLPSGGVQTNLYIERLLSRTVALVASCNSASAARWVVKFYASDWESRWHLAKELAAYDACSVLQGADVPVFYGEWSIAGTAPDACCALLMEHVAPGTTVVELQGEIGWEDMGLTRAVVVAVESVNRCGVAHRNLCGGNMVVGETGGVVIVDFGWAAVGGSRCADRWSLFQLGFLTAWDVPELG